MLPQLLRHTRIQRLYSVQLFRKLRLIFPALTLSKYSLHFLQSLPCCFQDHLKAFSSAVFPSAQTIPFQTLPLHFQSLPALFYKVCRIRSAYFSVRLKVLLTYSSVLQALINSFRNLQNRCQVHFYAFQAFLSFGLHLQLTAVQIQV